MALNPAAVAVIAEKVGLKTWPAFLDRACCDKKEIFLNGGWRGGKSSSAAFIVLIDIITKWLMTPGTHLIWLVGPDYAQARQEYFYLLEWLTRLQLQPVGDPSNRMDGPLRATFTRPGAPGTIEIATKQAGDPTSLGSVAPVIILACEAGQFSEEAMMWLLGRTAEKNATLIWSGTFENEDGKAQYAWFEEASERAWTQPTPRQSAFRLPTWENLSIYDSCLRMITDDPSLALWCPPTDTHGESHSGLNHPMIRKLADQWKDKPKDWRKRFGGEPMTTRNQVYEWAELDRIDDITGNKYLISLSEIEKRLGHPMQWVSTAGGLDPGLVHPAGIVIASRNLTKDIWVRNAKRLKTNGELFAWKDRWAEQYGRQMVRGGRKLLKWGGDPVGLRFTRPGENITPMTGSVWGREERASIVTSYAVGIDNRQHLYFDADNEGVRQTFAEAQSIHRKRKATGEWGYNREADDLMAGAENAIVMLHTEFFQVSNRQQIYRPRATDRPLVTPRVVT